MNLTKKRIRFLFLMILAGSLFILIYLAAMGNCRQVYSDIVLEYTSILSSNKTAERNLIYILIFAGLGVYSIYYIISQKKCRRNKEALFVCKEQMPDYSGIILCLLAVMAVSYYFVYTYLNPILFVSLTAVFVIFIIDRSLVVYGFIFFYMGIYAVSGIYRIYVLSGGEKAVSSITVSLIVITVLIMLLASKKRKAVLWKACLIEQSLIPGVLLVYLSSKYMHHNRIVEIPIPRLAGGLVSFLIGSFFIEGFARIWKNWTAEIKLEKAVGFGTCVSIMAFNMFDPSGAVIPADLHHPFENIIGYSQIFKLGQKPFSEYIPVSGMYSIVQGAFFEFFGQGKMGYYQISKNIFYLAVIVIIIMLLRMQADSVCIFIISLIFRIIDYNRVVFLLPVMLLLIMPKLIKRKNLWLKVWFLTSLFHGLYYPVFGAAVCIAFLPLGIWQGYTYVREGQIKTEIRTVRFWAGWIICLILMAVCIPCLAGTYQHIKAMAGQTVYADGIARFGQMVPDWFFPYMDQYQVIRISLYLVFSFIIPAGFVWSAYAVFLKAGSACIQGKKLILQNKQKAAVCAALIIMPVISYSSTIIRLDIGELYARSTGVLLAGMILLFVISNRFLRCEKIIILIVCATVFIPTAVNSIGFFSVDSKLSAYYSVPDDYVYVENDKVNKWGTCFVLQSMYVAVSDVYDSFINEDKDQSYIGKPSQFGFFYLCDRKGDGTMEVMLTVKGYQASQEAVRTARKNKSIIGAEIHPFYNYYFYHWLITSGEYVWSNEKSHFLPNEGNLTLNEVKERNKNLAFTDGLDIGKNAGSLGTSMDSLIEIMEMKNLNYTVKENGNGIQINFDQLLDGDETDYMYIEFSDMDHDYQYTLYDWEGEQEQTGGMLSKYFMKKNYNPGMDVFFHWSDDNGEVHSMHCAMNQGKLLIPLGAGSKWLLHKHKDLSISVMMNGNEIELPAVEKVQFLKLRQL